METNEPQVKSENITRKGLHKFIHVTRLDTYISSLCAAFFFVIVFIEAGPFGLEISFITWTDALQLAILCGIFGIVARLYYHFFEERYDK
jgi:hypothetical protein